MAQWCCAVTVFFVLLVASTCSADWTLVVAHSNDLWFQLDEIKADNTPCYVDLPPVPTTTPTIPTTTETPPTTPPSTETTLTTPSTTETPTTTQSSTTTSSPTTSTTEITVPSESESESSSDIESPSTAPTAKSKMSKSSNTAASSPSQLSTVLHRRRRRRQATLSSLVNASTAYSTLPVNVTSSHSVSHNRTTISPLNLITSSISNETHFNATAVPYFNNTTTTSTTAKPNRGETADCYGGVSRHLTMARQLKAESESKGKVFLHLNAGGMLGGNIWFPILGSGPAAESVAKLNYHAIALGYRDFDEGVPTAAEYLKQLKNYNVTVLCANIDTSQEPAMAGLIEKSKVVDIDGHKIGIIGYIGADADYVADTGKLTFEDEAIAIAKEITILFEKGVNFIIALGNAGYDRGQILLNKTLNVDLIVNGGGTSVFQYTGGNKGPLNETIKDPYPFVWKAPGYGDRLLVTTSRYGKYMGKLELTIDDQGKIKGHSSDSNPILLDTKVQQDNEMQLQVNEWERTVLIESNETIGYTKLPIVSDRSVCWYRECTGASMMADAARWYLEHNVTVNNNWYDSVAAVVWHGGALSNTDLGLTAEPIKFGDILYMFPYANVLAMARMTGTQIKMLFENSVANYNDTSAPKLGEFLHASGMRIEYDLSKEKGSRVVSITIRDTSNPDGEHAPLKLDSVYRIGMPSFIARGGSNYAFMDTIPHEDTGIRDEIALRAFISWTTPLAYGNDGRIKFVQSDVNPEPNCPNVNVTGTVFLTIFLTLLFAGLTFAAFKYLYPKLRDRRGSMMSLVR